MKIDSLLIKNFRNLEKTEFYPADKLNILIGDNAQGKTNFLEAIFMLATASSFRTNKDINLLNYEQNSFLIKGKYHYLERKIESTLQFDKSGNKKFLINNKKAVQNKNDRLRVVVFTPDDLFLIKGSPAKRRNFVDFIIKQLSDEYFYAFNNYNKILKKRNLLLKNEQTNSETFAFIEQLFIENAVKLVIQRINFINILNEIASQVHKDINNNKSELKIRYALSFPVNSDRINSDILQSSISEHIKSNFKQELIRKKTMTGPHLDDIHFYLDERPARIFASQGQQRNIIISLKLAELYAFQKIKGYYPIFLLDEVLSELDEDRRKLLLNYLKNANFQSYMTSVSLDMIDDTKTSIHYVKNGRLIRKEL